MEVIVLTALLFFYFKLDSLMATDAKLDEVRAFIVNLQGLGGATAEQLTELLNVVNASKASAEAVLAEADALDQA